jgi:hypothetical protein
MSKYVAAEFAKNFFFTVMLTEAVSTSETSVSIYETTRCNIPEDTAIEFIYIKKLYFMCLTIESNPSELTGLLTRVDLSCLTVLNGGTSLLVAVLVF